jgi:hypothetical protein
VEPRWIAEWACCTSIYAGRLGHCKPVILVHRTLKSVEKWLSYAVEKRFYPSSLGGGAPTPFFNLASKGEKLLLGLVMDFNSWKSLEDGFCRFCCVVRQISEKKRMKKRTTAYNTILPSQLRAQHRFGSNNWTRCEGGQIWVRSEVEVHPNTILFGIEQRNDLRAVKYLWPFLCLLYFIIRTRN